MAIRLDENLSIYVGCGWMHASNGQGLGPQNPSYEGVGFLVGLVGRL